MSEESHQVKLNDQQLRFYETFGFLKFPELFKDEVGDITDAFEQVWAESGRTHDFKKRSMIIPFPDSSEYLSRLLEDPRIDGVVSSILGDDYNYSASDGNYYVGDTNWHSDHLTDSPYRSLKIAFYLDPVRRESGCLRVIPGSCHDGDRFSEALNPVAEHPREGHSEKLWGVNGSELPGQALESDPGDMLLFNHKTKHSSFGGGDQRRMFTYNFEQRFPDEILPRLRDLVRPYIEERGMEQAYGAALLRVASPRYRRHMEQRMAVWAEILNEA